MSFAQAAKIAQLQQSVDELKKQLEELKTRLEAVETKPRGRPAKDKE